MLLLRETRVVITKHEPVATGVVLNEEGFALAYVKEDGVTKVQPSTGVPGEIFAGVNLARNAPPTVLPMVNEGRANAQAAFELSRAPIAGQLLVKVDGTKYTVVTTTPSSGEVQISGTTLQLPAGDANKEVFAQYMYQPTVVEAATIVGNLPAGGIPAVDTTGVLKEAQLGTSKFDASVDWSGAMYVKLAAGGTFTVGDATDHIPNVVVKNTPSAASPFLVLSINVA